MLWIGVTRMAYASQVTIAENTKQEHFLFVNSQRLKQRFDTLRRNLRLADPKNKFN